MVCASSHFALSTPLLPDLGCKGHVLRPGWGGSPGKLTLRLGSWKPPLHLGVTARLTFRNHAHCVS